MRSVASHIENYFSAHSVCVCTWAVYKFLFRFSLSLSVTAVSRSLPFFSPPSWVEEEVTWTIFRLMRVAKRFLCNSFKSRASVLMTVEKKWNIFIPFSNDFGLLQITSIFQVDDFLFILSLTSLCTFTHTRTHIHLNDERDSDGNSTRRQHNVSICYYWSLNILCERWSLTVYVSVFYSTMHCQLEMFSIVQSLSLSLSLLETVLSFSCERHSPVHVHVNVTL